MPVEHSRVGTKAVEEAATTAQSTAYAAEIAAWRAELEATLRRDWIGLAGRFELHAGQLHLGSDPAGDIVLPPASVPATIGLLDVVGATVTLQAAPDVSLLVNGEAAEGRIRLRSDAAGTPDFVSVGSLTLWLIQRGPRTILRVRDADSPLLRSFGGRRWFPIDAAYRIEGHFQPYDPPRPLAITTILGDTSAEPSPGGVHFELGGQQHHLEATGWRDGGLVLHFRDATTGATSVGGGRALVTSAPHNNLVTLDFNRAANLPCAFTAFATCPLPPAQNRLGLAIAAGERRPEDD